MAAIWESKQQDNLENTRNFLLKGLQRHPNSEELYLELFDIELINLAFNADSKEEEVSTYSFVIMIT